MSVQCASFPMGNVVITPNTLDQLTPADVQLGLQRHQAGDWGNLGEEDWKENDDALANGRRLLSSYRSGSTTFWIITSGAPLAYATTVPSWLCNVVMRRDSDVNGISSVRGWAASNTLF